MSHTLAYSTLNIPNKHKQERKKNLNIWQENMISNNLSPFKHPIRFLVKKMFTRKDQWLKCPFNNIPCLFVCIEPLCLRLSRLLQQSIFGLESAYPAKENMIKKKLSCGYLAHLSTLVHFAVVFFLHTFILIKINQVIIKSLK